MTLQVSVVGSSGSIDDETAKKAYKLGRLLAEKGYIVISGGLDGVMEATFKGASDAGGITVGIIPSLNKEDANKYCKIVIPTGLGYARNFLNVSSADVVIAIKGGKGTLSEIAMALVYHRPVICVKGTGGVSDLRAGRRIGEDKILEASSVEEAVKMIESIMSDKSVK